MSSCRSTSKDSGKGEQPLGRLIGELLARRGLVDRLRVQGIRERIGECVGPRLLEGLRVVGVRNGLLTLVVPSHAAKHEIEGFYKSLILEGLRAAGDVPEADRIRCQVQP